MSRISQCTGEATTKSHPFIFEPLLQLCDTQLFGQQFPRPGRPSAPRSRQETPALGAFLGCHEGKGVRGEREAAEKHRGVKNPFNGKLREGSFFSHIPGIGALRSDALLHHLVEEPLGCSPSPWPPMRAQIHAHTHSQAAAATVRSPHPGPPYSPPAPARKQGLPSAGGAAGEGSEAPALTDGLPTATAIAAAAPAPAAPGCSPPTLAAPPAPARLPRGSLAAALCSRPAPARSQQHLLPPRRRPSCFIRATWPPAWKGPFASPGRGVSLRAWAEAVGRRMVGGSPTRVGKLRPQGSPSPNVAVGPEMTLSGATVTPPACALAATPRSTTCWSPSKSLGAEVPAQVPPRASRSGQLERLRRGGRDTGKAGPRGQHLAES